MELEQELELELEEPAVAMLAQQPRSWPLWGMAAMVAQEVVDMQVVLVEGVGALQAEAGAGR